MKRRTSSRIANREKKRQMLRAAALVDPVADHIGLILELGTASVWAFLSGEEISSSLQAFSSVLSNDFVEPLAQKTLDQFATENKIHLGRNCTCDWMQSFDFKSFDSEKCERAAPFSVDKSMPILQEPGGGPSLLNAQSLVKRILLPYCVHNRRGQDLFTPVVGLLPKGGNLLRNEADVKRAMNRVCNRAGTRFVCKFTGKRRYTTTDFIDEHRNYIDGLKCTHCESLPRLHDESPRREKWTRTRVQYIRENCANVYQPLKVAMETELKFVRFIPRPYGVKTKYAGLVAGIAPDGVFCGLYLAKRVLKREPEANRIPKQFSESTLTQSL